MYSKFLLLLLLAVTSTFVWFGCEESCQDCHWNPDIPSIQIVTELPSDTIRFLYHDSVFTGIIVILKYGDNPAQGQKVDIELSDPTLGVIEYFDDQLRDTTDEDGQVHLQYLSFPVEGNQVITASAGGITASRTMVVRQFDFATFTAEVTLNVDTVYVDQWVQPILQMRVLSEGRIPVPNLIVPYGIPGEIGEIQPFPNIGPTDQNGYAESPLPLYPWSTPHTYCVSMVFTRDDSVCVVLR